MLLEDRFIDKSPKILRISNETPGLMHEPFSAVYWDPAMLPMKIKAANASSHTFKSHIAESELNSQKRNGLFLMWGPCKVHCDHNPVLSCSWEPTWAFATACWEATRGLSAEGGKLISQCFFNTPREAKGLHSGKKSPIPKHLRWDTPFKAAPAPCLSSKDAPSRRTTLCIFFSLWSTSMESTNRWI